jgi:aminoglycoside phosphotransferase (APT) family kinase protein
MRPPPRRLPRAALETLCRAVAPGARIAAVRRLRGGIEASTVAVSLIDADGSRRQVVVRALRSDDPEKCTILARGAGILAALSALDLPVPAPLHTDASGSVAGRPTIVLERLPGRPTLQPADPDRWLVGLAESLARVHTTPLPPAAAADWPGPDWIAGYLEAPPTTHGPDADHPDAAAVWAALRRLWPTIVDRPRVVTHGDYWPGNVLWYRRRVSGIVDWDESALAPSGRDVGCCRQDLAFLGVGGAAAPDTFARAYEAAGGTYRDLAFWDLFAAQFAIPDPVRWYLPGYHDLGRADITPEAIRARHRAFIADALARAPT